jgi:hypothetical protein
MATTLKTTTGGAIFLERIARAWDKRDDLTFGQLIYESLVGDHPLDAAINLRRLDDRQIAEAVERFVLRG